MADSHLLYDTRSKKHYLVTKDETGAVVRVEVDMPPEEEDVEINQDPTEFKSSDVKSLDSIDPSNLGKLDPLKFGKKIKREKAKYDRRQHEEQARASRAYQFRDRGIDPSDKNFEGLKQTLVDFLNTEYHLDKRLKKRVKEFGIEYWDPLRASTNIISDGEGDKYIYTTRETVSDVPRLVVYLDSSGSFSSTFQKKIREEIQQALSKWESAGLVRCVVKYFAGKVYDYFYDDGDTKIGPVLKNIERQMKEAEENNEHVNVLIVTDGGYSTDKLAKVVIDGAVFAYFVINVSWYSDWEDANRYIVNSIAATIGKDGVIQSHTGAKYAYATEGVPDSEPSIDDEDDDV